MNRHGIIAAIALTAVMAAAPARAAEPLTVCFEQNSPPYSFRHHGKTGGFDLSVAAAVAAQLGRPFKVRWYEAETPERDENIVDGIAALLADGRCAMVGAYPLYADALGSRPAKAAILPDSDGRRRADLWRPIKLHALAASHAYQYAPLAVVLRRAGAQRRVTSLVDLAGLRIGAQQGSLADSILMLYGGGRLAKNVVHVGARQNVIEQLEQGDYDAALVDLHRFEAYRSAHPRTGLVLTGYRHSLGFNMGFVTLADDHALIGQVDAALAALKRTGTLVRLARDAGISYLAPVAPEVRPPLSLAQLSSD